MSSPSQEPVAAADGWPIDQACPLLLAAAGREPSHTAAFVEHGMRIGALMVASGFGEPIEAARLINSCDTTPTMNSAKIERFRFERMLE